jgi:hypothetical protein
VDRKRSSSKVSQSAGAKDCRRGKRLLERDKEVIVEYD